MASGINIVEHFKRTHDGIYKCNYCEKPFKGPSRLRYHLSGEPRRGIVSCEKVPENIRAAILAADSNRRLECGSVNNENAGLQIVLHNADRSCGMSSVPEPIPKRLRTREDSPIPLLTAELVGDTYQEKLKEIWSSLMKEDVSKIGVYGMGGVGKTELARRIHNKLLEDPHFDFVCWLTVSPEFSVRKLQSIIANAINFDMSNKDDEIIKAELSRRLVGKKFVMILDDVWTDIALHDLGVKDGSLNGCKLILTTRSFRICQTMNCQKNVLVLCPYGKNEHWDMFMKELGKEESLSGEIVMVAKSIVDKCCGLPLMIKSMARSMRGLEDIHEWRNALEEIKSLKTNEPYVEVLHKLKRSFDNLKDQSLQQCLLYCALFDQIIKEDLIEHLIVEGIVEGKGNRRAKYDRGHSLLNKLHKACLLNVDDFVSMHGLIRRMTFRIMRENLPSETEFTEEEVCLCMKDIMRISLRVPKEVFNPSDYEATCPNVSSLLLRDTERLASIGDSFTADQFRRLKVLNFSHSGIKELPNSVGGLKNLKALFLEGCEWLEHIPSLAKLESLEVLDLRYCAVKEVPHGVECLSNLRVLNLLRTRIKELGAGILKRLLHLEFLAFDRPSKLAEEIAGLPKLESLIWCFSDIEEFHSFFSMVRSPSLIAFSIYVGQCDWYKRRAEPEPRGGRKVSFSDCKVGRELLIQEDIDMLSFRNLFGWDTDNGVPPLTPDVLTFSNLKSFQISDCETIRKLFHLDLLSNLQQLEDISVSRCAVMEEIIAEPEQEPSPLQFSLPKLKTLYLEGLTELKSICSGQIKCESLENIVIFYSEKLEKIPISLPLPSLKNLKVRPEEWWKSVHWDSSDQKDLLQPQFEF